LIPGLAARRDRKTPPRTGAKPHAIWRPHMKTLLRIRAHGYAARPIRLGHMTNSLFTFQSAQTFRFARKAVSPNLLRTSRAPPGIHHWLHTGGGGERIRTDDLLLAKQALSQLSYTPFSGVRGQEPGNILTPHASFLNWWAREDLNLRPHAYQARALTS
jgi:hypothetical protein